MAEKKGFEGLEPVFGDARAELEPAAAAADVELRPFLFYLHAPDAARLQFVASDFHNLTWERSLDPHNLEDMRDEIGVGGSSSEFLDYLIESVSSGDVKIVLGVLPNIKGDSGLINAKLVAHKSKGLPRVSLPLNRLMNSSASDAMANLSLALYVALEKRQNIVMKERECSIHLEGLLSLEREKCESLQKQLDSLSFLSKRKLSKTKTSDKTSSGSDTFSSSITASENHTASGQIPSTKDPQSTKVNQRAAPVSRRARVRGVSLQDTEDGDDNY